ncbi:MAG: SUMF1/EgtB/PvdO family nonheme iron enzyme [Blastocatellia bacterium]|nr:SUMF1/EgtB/PvdO family nonheme iron enzyme [Blastocatellia bacterium]
MDRVVQIFISYAREDQARIEALYRRLQEAGYQPWLDRDHILAGQKWEPVIKAALKQSDFVLVCLSATSINKRGFLQEEIKQALEHARQKLDDDVWLIPARLDDCDVPEALADIQWVDLFDAHGVEDLLRALAHQLRRMGRTAPSRSSGSKAQPAPLPISTPGELFNTVKLDDSGKIVERTQGQARLFIDVLSPEVKVEMIELPGGEFWMGSTEAEAQKALSERRRWNKDAKEEWFTRESPRHRVKLAPFLIGKYPVTQAQWYEVMGDLPAIDENFQGDNRPIVNINWEEATAFCRELTRRTNHQYRLPTEAEWEYACRAGSTRPFAFGPTITPEIVNYDGNFPYGKAPKGEYRRKTIPVGSLGVANAFGLFDMHGNVWEWCSDWFGAEYYKECHKQGVVSDPQGPVRGSFRVFRGGSWGNGAVYCRSADRSDAAPGIRYDVIGLRLVRIGP